MATAFLSYSLDTVPGEEFLVSCLQKPVTFTLGERIVKSGRLILFKRFHYFIQIALLSDKNVRENIEIPIPFDMEVYPEEGLVYFDYRISALNTKTLPRIPEKVSSMYFNKILELAIQL